MILTPPNVIPELVPGTHTHGSDSEIMGGRDKPGHDEQSGWRANWVRSNVGKGAPQPSASQSADRISCSREAVRSNSKAPSPSGYSFTGSASARTISLVFAS